MSYVEGIGDEVLVSVTIVTIILISLLLWSLTEYYETARNTTYRNPQASLEEQVSTHIRTLIANFATENHPEQAESSVPNNASADLPQEEAIEEATTEDAVENSNIETECESTPTNIRQRRLDFFNKNNIEDVHESRQNCSNNLSNGSVSGATRDMQAEEGESSSSRLIQIRLKYLDDTERTVQTRPLQTIQEFKRTHFAEEMVANKLVRLISTGYVLEDSRTLQSYGLMDSSVVHVQIQTNQANTRRPSNDVESELDIGQFLSPILGVALLCVWIMHFQYKEYFTTTATVALLILSGLFLTVVWGQHGSRTLNNAVQ